MLLQFRAAVAASAAREASRQRPEDYDEDGFESLVETMMVQMVEADAALVRASLARRTTVETLPGLETIDRDLRSAALVRDYSLGVTRPVALRAPRPAAAGDSADGAYGPTEAEPRAEGGAAPKPGRGGLAAVEYDRSRRRNAYPTLPGFQARGEEPGEREREFSELQLARQPGRGGLIRTFLAEVGERDTTRAHHNSINQVVFSLDEKRVASGSSDTTIRLWDTISGRLVTTLVGHKEAVNCVAFSDEGQRLIRCEAGTKLAVRVAARTRARTPISKRRCVLTWVSVL